jgi:hypothetical protein
MRERGGLGLATLALVATATTVRPAAAAPLLGPDAALEAKAATYLRQQEVFSNRENGLFLDTFVKPADIPLVQSFFAQTAQKDFQAFSGKHPFDVVESFDEYGDEGNFSGVGSVGLAARLVLARKAGDPQEIAAARAAAVRAARAWHVYGAIGGPGVVARGVRRIAPEVQGQPGTAGPIEPLVPLADGQGQPLPADKHAVWRAPVAPGFQDWIWFDDTSKDQVSGYALAASWLWDVLQGDPDVPKDVVDALAADLRAFGRALMKVQPENGIDLCIRDADGRLTRFYDINPRTLSPGGPPLPEESTIRNGFNAAMALAIVRAAYHVSGDPDLGRYYYEELVGRRDLPAQMAQNAGALFVGVPTNYSNANMLAISLALLGRIETDPYVRQRLDQTLAKQFWDTGDSRDVSHVKQAWFDAVWGAYASAGDKGILDARIRENLGGFQDAPAFNRERINCDMQELMAGTCLAIDGKTTIVLAQGSGWNGKEVAADIVPMSVRPDSNFLWRSDPHQVNGGGSNRMNPGGDFVAAYYLARVSDTQAFSNRSPFARPPLPYERGGGETDAGVDGGTGVATSGGCGCALPAGAPGGWGAAGALLALGLAGRRRRARRG